MVCVLFKSCQCGRTMGTLQPCKNLAVYEKSKVVKWKGIELVESGIYPKLSSFKDDYIDEIRKELESFFPQAGDVNRGRLDTTIFNPLNQNNWPDQPDSMKSYQPRSIEKIAKLFKIPYTQELQTEFSSLVKKILLEAIPTDDNDEEIGDAVANYVTNHPSLQSPTKKLKLASEQKNFFCEFKESDPIQFWVSVLFRFSMSRELETLIKSTIIIPSSSADAERGIHKSYNGL